MYQYTITYYETSQGNRPFQKWLSKLKDLQAQVAIDFQIRKFMLGDFGDWKVCDGIQETRFNKGQVIEFTTLSKAKRLFFF